MAVAEFGDLDRDTFAKVSAVLQAASEELSFGEEDAVRRVRVADRRVAQELYGMELDTELKRRGLPVSGTADEKKRWLQERFDCELEERIREDLRLRRQEKAELAKGRARVLSEEGWERSVADEERALAEDAEAKLQVERARDSEGPRHLSLVCGGLVGRALSKAVWQSQYVVSLSFSGSFLGDDCAAYVARALRKNSSLLLVDLEAAGCGRIFLETLAESLCHNQTLEALILDRNIEMGLPEDGDGGSHRKSMRAFCDALRRNRRLRNLSLIGCHLGAEFGGFLADAMPDNEGLVALDTAYNCFSDTQDKRIWEAVHRNQEDTRERSRKAQAEATEALRRENEAKALAQKALKEQDLVAWLDHEAARRSRERQLLELLSIEEDLQGDSAAGAAATAAEEDRVLSCFTRRHWPRSKALSKRAAKERRQQRRQQAKGHPLDGAREGAERQTQPKEAQKRKPRRVRAADRSRGDAKAPLYASLPKNHAGVELMEVPGYRENYRALHEAQRRAEAALVRAKENLRKSRRR